MLISFSKCRSSTKWKFNNCNKLSRSNWSKWIISLIGIWIKGCSRSWIYKSQPLSSKHKTTLSIPHLILVHLLCAPWTSMLTSMMTIYSRQKTSGTWKNKQVHLNCPVTALLWNRLKKHGDLTQETSSKEISYSKCRGKVETIGNPRMGWDMEELKGTNQHSPYHIVNRRAISIWRVIKVESAKEVALFNLQW